MVQSYKDGASTFADPDAFKERKMTGQIYKLPAGTELPEGFGVIADGSDVTMSNGKPGKHYRTHHTIVPCEQMTAENFVNGLQSLPWEKSIKIK